MTESAFLIFFIMDHKIDNSFYFIVLRWNVLLRVDNRGHKATIKCEWMKGNADSPQE
jgi:hypothetical protein